MSVQAVKESFDTWVGKALQDIHRRGYKPPPVRRVYIPKPGKVEKRPIGVPCVADRAIQRSVASVLSQIYEQDFLPTSFGGRPKLSAHNALCTFNEIIMGRKIDWIFEADLKNFFGTLNHDWLVQFVEHRVGDPRILVLIKRWLKAGVMEDGRLHFNKEGTPQGGSVSMILSNVYMHYVLDIWFERIVKPRLNGQCYLIRYIDDFVVCFQYESDAKKFQNVLVKRLAKFSLELEPSKTKLIEFGRFSKSKLEKLGQKQETLYFLGFTHYCSKNRSGNFQVSRKTEKGRLKRSMVKIRELTLKNRHRSVKDQALAINQVLRGHYGYYGLGGNLKALQKVHRHAEFCWRKALSKRCWKGKIDWIKFQKISSQFPLQRPELSKPYSRMKEFAVL